MLTHNMTGIGGSFMRAHSLAKSLANMGHTVTLLASRRFSGLKMISEVHERVQVIQSADILPSRLRHGGLSPMDIAGRMKNAMQAHDIVHGFDHRPAVSFPALLARRKHKIPYVADWADLWGKDGIAAERGILSGLLLGSLDHYWEQRVHKIAEAVTVISSDLGNRALMLGVPEERIRDVPVGSNADEITPLPQAAMRSKHKFPQEARVLTHIGFAPYDAKLLAESFAILAKSDPRVVLAITGTSMGEVNEVAEAEGFADRVWYLGFVPYHQLEEILSCGDVMLLPFSNRSINRARYPNRFGDYLAAGRPIATNLTGDLGQTVVDERIGIATEDKPEAFAAGILELLEDDSQRKSMGRRARQLAEGRYSWRSIAQTVSNLYDEILDFEVGARISSFTK
ncbi:MAG: glycosyltransferase family 4 protein [Anaerolineales bacterium]